MLSLLVDVVMFTLSPVSIEPGADPSIVATVTFYNTITNTPIDNREQMLTLELEGRGIIEVPIKFTFNVKNADGADSIEVIPPSGLVCSPSCITLVPEYTYGKVDLIEYVGF